MADSPRKQRCAIYTRKSSEEGLEQDFNSLHAQREACEAFILSQKHEGWRLDPTAYDDGGFSGGTMERPAFQRLLTDIRQGLIDVVVVYKVDRLTRSLADFSKIVETFDAHGVSFVSVTQQFNTSTSMGRLTLNVLLSFAQFEREVTGERIRDKLALSARKGLWRGGNPPLGYDVKDKKLIVNAEEAKQVRAIYERYLELGEVRSLKVELDRKGVRSKPRVNPKGEQWGGASFSRGALYLLLKNRTYVGDVVHKGTPYPGAHEAILEQALFDRVQEKLEANRTFRREARNAKEPSLLASLVVDDRGNVMTPTHTSKNGRRYRYYVCQAVIQFRPDDAGAVRRVPAHDIESLVTDELLRLLRDGPRLLDALRPQGASADLDEAILSGARRVADGFAGLSPWDQRVLLRRSFEKIQITPDEVKMLVSRKGLAGQLGLDGRLAIDPDLDPITIQAEARLKRLGGELHLIVKDRTIRSRTPKSDPSLIDALVQAWSWRKGFLADPSLQLKDVGEEIGQSPSYISRMMRLAYLAPDICEAILQGTQPPDISLKRLLRGIPLSWQEQRQKFGFPNP